MNKFEKIKKEIIAQLDAVNYYGDLSDIGNEIGIVVGKYISEIKTGYEKAIFIHGINHGISLSNGTHG